MNEALDNPLHHRRADTVSEKLDAIATGANFQFVGGVEAHRALQFRNLEHSKGRLPTRPFHQPEPIKSCKCPKWAVE